MTVTVVVPVRNESKNLHAFLSDFQQSLNQFNSVQVDFLFIEDTSSDNTLQILKDLSAQNPSIRVVSLKKGFGQAAAVVKGVEIADKSDAIVMMDADSSHPTEVAVEMIRQFLAGADIVQGIRATITHRGFIRETGSQLFGFLVKTLTGANLKSQNVYFRLISRKFRDEFMRTPVWWQTLRLPYASVSKTYNVRYVEFKAPDRRAGVSNYTFYKLVKFTLQGILCLMTPMRLLFWLFLLNASGFLIYWPLEILFLPLSLWIHWQFQVFNKGTILKKLEISFDSRSD